MKSDEVQNSLPQNMATWHIVYFKLKEFDKWQVTFPFSLEAGQEILM